MFAIMRELIVGEERSICVENNVGMVRLGEVTSYRTQQFQRLECHLILRLMMQRPSRRKGCGQQRVQIHGMAENRKIELDVPVGECTSPARLGSALFSHSCCFCARGSYSRRSMKPRRPFSSSGFSFSCIGLKSVEVQRRTEFMGTTGRTRSPLLLQAASTDTKHPGML